MASTAMQALGNGQTPQNTPNMEKMFEQFKANPAQYLMKASLNIPQTMNNPEQIVRHLAQTNQIPPQLRGMVDSMLKGGI